MQGERHAPMTVGHVDKAPFFLPWIGADYENRAREGQSNWHVHALGESHYPNDYEIDPSLTQRVVRDWAFQPGRGSLFFRRVIQAIEGIELDEVDAHAHWKNIAFSNYVQSVVAAPRMPPSQDQWLEASRAFFGQLAITRPRVLLVLGRRLWDRLPSGEENRLPPLALPDPSNPVTDAWGYAYMADGCPCFTIAVWSYHPSSSRFDWRDAHRRVTAAEMYWDNLSISIFGDLGW